MAPPLRVRDALRGSARQCSVSTQAVREWEQHGRLCALRTVGGARLFAGHDVLKIQQGRSTKGLDPAAPATR